MIRRHQDSNMGAPLSNTKIIEKHTELFIIPIQWNKRNHIGSLYFC